MTATKTNELTWQQRADINEKVRTVLTDDFRDDCTWVEVFDRIGATLEAIKNQLPISSTTRDFMGPLTTLIQTERDSLAKAMDEELQKEKQAKAED